MKGNEILISNANNYTNSIYLNSPEENNNSDREALIKIEEEVSETTSSDEIFSINRHLLTPTSSSSLKIFTVNAKEILRKLSAKKPVVEVNTEEKESQNNKAQLDKVLALFGFRLEESSEGFFISGQREFTLEKIQGISEKKEEAWGRKVLVCTQGDPAHIVCFKLEKRYLFPNFLLDPCSVGKNDLKIKKALEKKADLQKERIDFTKRELKALLGRSGITLDENSKEIDWHTTREGIRKFFQTNLKASPSAVLEAYLNDGIIRLA